MGDPNKEDDVEKTETERTPVAEDVWFTGVVATKGTRTLYREVRDFDPAHPRVGPWWYGEEVEDGELIEACHFKTRRDGKEWVESNVCRFTMEELEGAARTERNSVRAEKIRQAFNNASWGWSNHRHEVAAQCERDAKELLDAME